MTKKAHAKRLAEVEPGIEVHLTLECEEVEEGDSPLPEDDDTPPPEKKESAPSESSGGATPPRGPSGADGTYNCDDFDTQSQAQQYFDEKGDVDGLDRDSDGVPCETLP